jgi:hypothetical protein
LIKNEWKKDDVTMINYKLLIKTFMLTFFCVCSVSSVRITPLFAATSDLKDWIAPLAADTIKVTGGTVYKATKENPEGVPHGNNGDFAIDLGAPDGTIVIAPFNGLITEVVKNWEAIGKPTGGNNDYGNFVRIKTDDGNEVILAHMLEDSIVVAEGINVSAGTKIGIIGSTGDSEGVHLHFEITSQKVDEVVNLFNVEGPAKNKLDYPVTFPGYTGFVSDVTIGTQNIWIQKYETRDKRRESGYYVPSDYSFLH